MKIRSVLIAGWLLGLAAAAGEEKPAASPPPEAPKPELAPEDTDPSEVPSNDPFASPSWASSRAKIPALRGKETRATLQLRLEVWEIETKNLAVRLDAVRGPADLEQWRKELLLDPAASLVQAPVLGLDEKSGMTGESILERIYPTEYEPPVFPPASLDPKEAKPDNSAWERWLEVAGKHAVPTSFETRNTGKTFEASIQPVTVEPNTWDASVSFDAVDLIGMESHGAIDLLIKMPAFTSWRANGIVRLTEGQWRLFSSMESPRGLDGKPTGKSWLTLVRVDRAR